MFISTYGFFEQQGVSVARMDYSDIDAPVGKVWKWHQAKWQETGLGGNVTPILPAKSNWHGENPDAFWGPSISYNTYLDTYVMLLNRAINPAWWQEGIYISFNSRVSS